MSALNRHKPSRRTQITRSSATTTATLAIRIVARRRIARPVTSHAACLCRFDAVAAFPRRDFPGRFNAELPDVTQRRRHP
jgi:hypothetical protein